MKTQTRTKGNRYNIINLIAELTKALQEGDIFIDIITKDDGWIDPDTDEWVEHLLIWQLETSK